MSVNNTQYFPYKITFGSGVTYDKSNGGVLEVTHTENPQVLSDKTSESVMPTCTIPVGYQPSVFVKLRDIEKVPVKGTKETLIAFSKTTSGNRSRTYANMIFIGSDSSVTHGMPGEVVLRFDLQSADGTTTAWFTDAAVT
jgi:hypothetical protein